MDVELGLRLSRGSPRVSGVGGNCSASRPRKGSGDGCIELLLVNTMFSGDIMGESCRELDATEEALMAEVGPEAEMPYACWRAVWTWLGRLRRMKDPCEARTGVETDACEPGLDRGG